MSCQRFEGVARWGRASQSSVKRFANIFGASSNTFCGADELQNSSAWARQGEACSVWHTLQRERERKRESVCCLTNECHLSKCDTICAKSCVNCTLFYCYTLPVPRGIRRLAAHKDIHPGVEVDSEWEQFVAAPRWTANWNWNCVSAIGF